MRDSKDRGRGPVLKFSRAQWTSFIRQALAGLPSVNGTVTMTTTETMTRVRCQATGSTLCYTAAEWAAFLDGARDGEFDVSELAVLATH